MTKGSLPTSHGALTTQKRLGSHLYYPPLLFRRLVAPTAPQPIDLQHLRHSLTGPDSEYCSVYSPSNSTVGGYSAKLPTSGTASQVTVRSESQSPVRAPTATSISDRGSNPDLAQLTAVPHELLGSRDETNSLCMKTNPVLRTKQKKLQRIWTTLLDRDLCQCSSIECWSNTPNQFFYRKEDLSSEDERNSRQGCRTPWTVYGLDLSEEHRDLAKA